MADLPRTYLAMFCIMMALGSFSGPFVFKYEGFTMALFMSFPLALLWVVSLTMFIKGKRPNSLWLLLSAPFALFWPYAAIALILHGGPT